MQENSRPRENATETTSGRALDDPTDDLTGEEYEIYDTSLLPSVDPEMLRFGEPIPPDTTASAASTVAPSPLEDPITPAATAQAAAQSQGPAAPEGTYEVDDLVHGGRAVVTPTGTEPPVIASAVNTDEGASGDDAVEAQDLIGRTVIDLARGKYIGTVRDVVFDPAHEQVAGFTVNLSGLLAGTRLLPWERVRSIGHDAVTIDNAGALEAGRKEDKEAGKREDRSDRLEDAREHGYPVIGKRILTDAGSFLGTVEDLVISRRTGRILGYRVAAGPWWDFSDFCYMPAVPGAVVGADVVTVPASVQQQIRPEAAEMPAQK